MTVEVQIDVADIVAVMQEMFPREYTICLQKCHISQLEALVEKPHAHPVTPEGNGVLP